MSSICPSIPEENCSVASVFHECVRDSLDLKVPSQSYHKANPPCLIPSVGASPASQPVRQVKPEANVGHAQPQWGHRGHFLPVMVHILHQWLHLHLLSVQLLKSVDSTTVQLFTSPYS